MYVNVAMTLNKIMIPNQIPSITEDFLPEKERKLH